MRLLAGMAIFQETAADNWKATPLVHALVSLSPLSKAIIHLLVHSSLQLYLKRLTMVSISALPSMKSSLSFQHTLKKPDTRTHRMRTMDHSSMRGGPICTTLIG